MDEPKPLDDVAREISGVLDLLIASLREALVEADNFHSDNGYDPTDDPSLVSSLVRRYVRALATTAMPGVVDPSSNMSPIFLHLGPYRLRVLHVHDGGLPPAQSQAREEYYAFNEEGILALNLWPKDEVVDLDVDQSVVSEFNLVLLWDAKGAVLTDATLVRPWVSTPSEFLDLLAIEVAEDDLDEIVKRNDQSGIGHQKAVNDSSEDQGPPMADEPEEGDSAEDLER